MSNPWQGQNLSFISKEVRHCSFFMLMFSLNELLLCSHHRWFYYYSFEGRTELQGHSLRIILFFFNSLTGTERQWIILSHVWHIGINRLMGCIQAVQLKSALNFVFRRMNKVIWILFWIPLEWHVSFQLMPDKFDVISAVTVDSVWINEDLPFVKTVRGLPLSNSRVASICQNFWFRHMQY